MAQFIDKHNQEILWSAFHKIPGVSATSYSTKENIFKNGISTIYNELDPQQYYTYDEIKQQNKTVLTYFMTLFRTNQINPIDHSLPRREQTPRQEQTPQQEQTTQQELKQQIIENPKEFFQEKTLDDDGAIQNMDELISEYQKLRDSDYPVFMTQKEPSLLDMIKQLEKRIEVLENTTRL